MVILCHYTAGILCAGLYLHAYGKYTRAKQAGTPCAGTTPYIAMAQGQAVNHAAGIRSGIDSRVFDRAAVTISSRSCFWQGISSCCHRANF